MAVDSGAPLGKGKTINYVVEEGDTFESLATRFYGDITAMGALAMSQGKALSDALVKGSKLPLAARLFAIDSLVPMIVNIRIFHLVGVDVDIEAACFVPGVELWEDADPDKTCLGEELKIDYSILDPGARVTSARLEVVRKKEPTKVLARIDLEEEQFTHGKHVLDWDGKCTEGDVADKYVHVAHSPYLVRVVGTTSDRDATGEAEAVIKITGLCIERGPDVQESVLYAAGTDGAYQLRLANLGFHPGPIDGKLGKKTKRAVKLFQHAHAGLRFTGRLDKYTKAYLDEVASPGNGLDHYQFILNYIGFGCGTIDGLTGRLSRRATERYRADKGLAAGTALDAATKAALDGEALAPLKRYEVLEGDGDDAAIPTHDNPFPVLGKEKKLYVECSSVLCPGSLPYNKKYKKERKSLVRAHFPVQARVLLETSTGKTVFGADATGPVRVNFTVDTAAPGGNLGVPNAVAQAYVKKVLTVDGHEPKSGHHAHKNRGGVRKDDDPGVFLQKRALAPYEVVRDGVTYYSDCVTEEVTAKGTAGVYFRPSTIAGDHFTIVATVDDKAIDTAPAPAITVQTGTMIVWRRYQVSKLWFMGYAARPHRTETQPQLGLPAWYDPAFTQFVEPVAPKKLVLSPRNADRSKIDLLLYTALLRDARYNVAQLSNMQIATRYAANILYPLVPAATYNAANEQAYHDAVDSEIMAFEERFANTLRSASYMEAKRGLVVLVFDDNAPTAGNFGINAMTNPNLGNWSWSLLAATAVLHLIDDQDTDASAVANGAIDGETLAHEFGHGLWLHHASTSTGTNPAASDLSEHNVPEYQSCTMSYVTLANFCGKCVLKLRGFDETKINVP